MYYFFGFSAIRAEVILDYWNKSDDFWDSLRSSQSSQSSESVSICVSVVRVVCDRLSSVSSRSCEHFLRRLGRSGRSGRSYGNQALRTTTTTLSTTTGSELRNNAQAQPVNFVVVVSSTSPNKVESHRIVLQSTSLGRYKSTVLSDFWSPLHFLILVNPGIVPFFS